MQLHNEKDLTKPAVLEVITPTQVRLTISEGRYHQVKRMFAAVGNHVVELHRERIGAIVLDDDLEPGEYRPLTEEEIASGRFIDPVSQALYVPLNSGVHL
ncbi:16S rRNA pseudouridylate synthase A [Citrobacter koseri]|uniref:16S rRNA pseudouridylate synthase A n=1 Tax=Citrobacter koseri TaxID=545 RepID=A0A2X2XR98_CITKO|nr:16S rRNA pseudouridylate synthase A [Citrobacter koseri]